MNRRGMVQAINFVLGNGPYLRFARSASSTGIISRGVALCSHQSLDETPDLNINDSKLVKAIVYEASKQFCNAKGHTLRFSDFLASQLDSYTNVSADPKHHKTITALAEDVKAYSQMSYDERLELLDRVAQVQGFSCTKDLVDHQNAIVEASQNLPRDADCGKNIPSPDTKTISYAAITFGSSEPIDLYSPMRRLSRSTNSIPSEVAEENQESHKTQEETRRLIVTKQHTLDVKVSEHQERHKAQEETRKQQIRPDTSGVKDSEHQERHKTQEETRISSVAKQHKRPDTLGIQKSPTLVQHPPQAGEMLTDWKLDTPLADLKCFTSFQKNQLQESGFFSARSLLNHFPRAHISFDSPTDTLEDGQYVSLPGTVVGTRAAKLKNALVLLEVTIQCSIGQDCLVSTSDSSNENTTVFLHTKRFYRGPRFANYGFLNKIISNYPEGSMVAVSGKIKVMNTQNHFEVKDYDLRVIEDGDANSLKNDGKAYPVYPAKGILQPKKIQQYIERLLTGLPENLDPLPENLRKKYELYNLNEAYMGLHCPGSMDHANLARRRFVFDDFFYLQLAFLLRGHGMMDEETKLLNLEEWPPVVSKLANSLPFKLTDGQIKAASEIMWDLRQPVPMSRFLQGDVGCGKTVVAFLALLDIATSGYQGALMAPTEFVASQHHALFRSWLELLDEKDRPRIALLTGGSTSTSTARQIREGLANKEIDIVIGTHALIANATRFSALGLAVIDEQHRFGVAQRDRLNALSAGDDIGNEEGNAKVASGTHILLMSATPIPRSLALTLHGDMSLSQITEIPPGRFPTQTHVLSSNEKGRQRAYQMIKKDLATGGKAFIVYKLIEESTSNTSQQAATAEFERLCEEFNEYKCVLVHGKMRPDVRNEEMKKFRQGDCQILVSTTVIEVGIDIPEASIILIENAEGYGVAQLHQLRGRVGRGKRKSTCILLSSCENSMPRLKLLESTNDGFCLAEADLRMRGPGDLLGKRQAGPHVEFVLARLGDDTDILEQARAAAVELLRTTDKNLDSLPNLKQEINMRQLPTSWS